METVQLTTVDDALIARVKDRIVDAYQPEAVYLFGSAARDTVREGSDIDLLVVMNLEEGAKTYLKAAEIHSLFDGWLVPLDILVQSPEQFERGRRLPGFVSRIAEQEGRLLYSRESNVAR